MSRGLAPTFGNSPPTFDEKAASTIVTGIPAKPAATAVAHTLLQRDGDEEERRPQRPIDDERGGRWRR